MCVRIAADISNGEDQSVLVACGNIESCKKLALAMLAGAHAIETNRRLQGASYARGFTTKEKPDLLSYYKATDILRRTGENILALVDEAEKE